ncbi:membrane-bound ClpP family serine protease [Bacillus pakistanensis]|uniref:Membrane-bound ClpP family serine protease n=2 Tax=Rossellomorea pakistanensis TaxID=992288 RepID=A0ABS2NJK6_9BACI|nr:membrane-bound ClpP family serine protease [Bacillus pakistanensis]
MMGAILLLSKEITKERIGMPMELFGVPIETIYLYLLIGSGCATLLYMFFGDALEGVAEATGFLNPTLVLAFITFFSASGYLFEQVTSLSSILIIIFSIIIALILDVLLNVFVLVPLSSAEESLVYTEDSLRGRVGKVIITIPENGFGEVVIESYSGMISKSAVSFDNTVIKEGTKIVIIDVIKGVLHVLAHENELENEGGN